MRMGGFAIGILVAILVPAGSALAANQPVTATTSNTFEPANGSVNVGEMVTWTNEGGLHNVVFDDGSFTRPAPADSSMWSVSRTFSVVGSFRYYCEIHGAAGGVGMSGAVTVQGLGGTPGPGPAPPPVAADKLAPALKLSGPTKQKASRRAVFVTVAVNEASGVTAKGTVSVPGAARVFRLKKASKQLAAGAKAKLKLRVPKQASRAFRRALARRVKLRARITVTAKDAAGNTRSAKRKIRLKR